MSGMDTEARFGILLSLNEEDFTSELKLTAAIMRNVTKQMQEDASIKMEFTTEEIGSTVLALRMRLIEINKELEEIEDKDAMNKLNKEAEEINQVLEYMANNIKRFSDETEKGSKKMEINLKGSVKQATKLALSLVGIRSVWGLVRRASSEYLADNKMLNQQLKLTFSILSQMIGPVIKTLVNMVEYAVIVLAKLVQIMTGYNVLTKANAAALKDLAKQAKKAHSALASFDTISNLSDNSDALEDYNAMVKAYNDFLIKQKEVDKMWKDWGPLITGITTALAGLWGIKTISGLAKLIGIGGTATTVGTGLAGVGSALAVIASLATIVISIAYNEEQKRKFEQELDRIVSDKAIEMNIKTRLELPVDELISSQQVNLKAVKEEVEWLNRYWNGAIGYKQIYDFSVGGAQQRIKGIENEIKANEANLQKYKEILETGEATEETLKKIYTTTQGQLEFNKQLKQIYEKAGKDTKFIDDNIEKQNDLLDLIDKKYGNIYTNATDINKEMEKATEQTEELNDIELKDKQMTVEINGDTTGLERTSNNWFRTFTTGIANWFNSNIMTSGMGSLFNVGKRLIGSVLKFDVGTNYVPNDMLAMVHKGEMIVPKKYNPMTSGLGGTNEETNMLLRQLNSTLEQKQFNGYISASDITNTAINGINQQSRIMGRSVIR